ncbi:hypothetical protein MMC24_005807 [Lignoscripta atroalba]|nr:hypothetical protein [Lignoscripta atroalba]
MRPTFFITSLLLAATTWAQDQSRTPDLTELLNSNKNLSQFSTLLQSYGDIYANLSFQQDVTIYAPSNEAFEKIPYQVLGPAFETNNTDIIRALLQYHVVPGLHPSTSFNGSFSFLPTWLNNETYSNVTGGQVVAGVQQAGNVWVVVTGLGSRSTVTTMDLKFTGGIVHVIDTFLIPPQPFTASANQFNLSSAAGVVFTAGLPTYIDTTDDLTFFVPNNAALQRVESSLSTMSTDDLAEILSYHVVSGSNFVGYSGNLPNGTILKTLQGTELEFSFSSNSIFVNSARILQQDLLLSNGVLHVIDNVLDYNSTTPNFNPELGTQVPILPGTATGENTLPFTTYLPTSTSVLFSLASPTDASTAFGATGTYRTASSTYGRALETSRKKGAGERVEMRSASVGAIVGALVWGLIELF